MSNAEVSKIAQAFVAGLRRILGDKVYGAYIFGAAAFPNILPTGDIDFHVILKGELTEQERSELEALHAALGVEFPPLGGEMDGYYILLSDAVGASPPQSQMWARATDNAWALHRAHIRAGRFIHLHGPEPSEIYAPASWPELEHALFDELDYVENHLQQYPDYCVLNLCRLIYSFETKNVVISKAEAAAWALYALPAWMRLIQLAQKSYARQATPEDRRHLLAAVGPFFEFAHARIGRPCEQARP
jgi:hypothetical protein